MKPKELKAQEFARDFYSSERKFEHAYIEPSLDKFSYGKPTSPKCRGAMYDELETVYLEGQPDNLHFVRQCKNCGQKYYTTRY